MQDLWFRQDDVFPVHLIYKGKFLLQYILCLNTPSQAYIVKNVRLHH